MTSFCYRDEKNNRWGLIQHSDGSISVRKNNILINMIYSTAKLNTKEGIKLIHSAQKKGY